MSRLPACDGHDLDAHEVHPDDVSASIVIVQEILGVNAHIRSVVDQYASFGHRAIAEAHPDVPVHVYAGADHGFNCDERPQHDARSAAIAPGRTLEFLAVNGVA